MKIVVFVKQVPDTTDVKWTVNNNIDRNRMDSILNPVDKSAVEAALYFKDSYGASVTVISMGPEKAVEVLTEVLAMGADESVLLTDSKFVGSDTCATSKVLASVIREKYSDVDVILFGQSAIDGETSQTGTSTASRLNMPFATQVNNILEYTGGNVVVTTDTEQKETTLKIKIPCVLCINNFVKAPRLPKISGYIKAQNTETVRYNHIDLGLNADETGVKGSPTFVSKVFKSPEGRICKFLDDPCLEEAVNVMKEVR